MLLIFVLKKVTKRMIPCGISFSWLWRSDKMDPTQTLKFPCKKKLLMMPGSISLRPRLCRSLKIPYFHVESRSKKIAFRCSFFNIKASLMKITRQARCSIGLLFLYIFTNPSAWAGYDTRSIFFKRSLTGLNSEFSFS